ncbi:MAG: hypothetical protein Q8918_11800 [Bacteroidota bacterium]|nr:hypothetical protein [Bacteroidota bacterium]MDP4212961.1 hypothetical protein [Bacteroidota bacterium]MDP4250783.1 hypothetical protein [Bacteroidota bacterium]
MKKNLVILALVLVGITGSSFATGNPDINKYVLTSFNQQFAGAHDARWESDKNFLKVSFQMDNQVLFAYYTLNGDLLAISRNISSNQLPVLLLISLKKEYAGYWISDLFEIHINDDSSYYVTVENGSQRKVLKSVDSNSWSTFKTENK